MSLEKCYIDLGDKEMCYGISYVALSRIKNVKYLRLKAFDLIRYKSIFKS